jgi:O-antigen ligase
MDDARTGSEARSLGPTATTAVVAALGVAAVAAALGVVTFKAFELDRFFVPKELALHVGALVAAIALATRAGDRTWGRADVAMAAWVGCSVASAVFATSAFHAWRAVGVTLSAGIVFWGAAAVRGAGHERPLVRWLATAATIAVGIALADAYGVNSDFFSVNRAPGGTLGNRNFVAHVAALALPVLVWLSATARNSARALMGAAAILMATAALVLSRTRAAWLALAVWGALMLPLALRHRAVLATAAPPGRWRVLGLALVAGIVVAIAVPNTLDWKSDSPYLDSVRGVVNYQEGSGAGRLKQYTNSLKMMRAHPVLGVGPGNWAAEYPAFAPRSDPSISDATGMTANPWPSSDWVAAISERGVPAFLALVTLVLVLLWHAWRGWSDAVFSSRERLGALAGGSVVLIGAIQGLFDAVTMLALPAILVWGVAGALVPPGATVRTTSVTPGMRRAAALVAVVVWGGLVATSAAKIEAMRLYMKGTYESVRSAAAWDRESFRIQVRAAEVQADRGNCRLAYHNARQAAALFPHSAQAQRLVARCAATPAP